MAEKMECGQNCDSESQFFPGSFCLCTKYPNWKRVVCCIVQYDAVCLFVAKSAAQSIDKMRER